MNQTSLMSMRKFYLTHKKEDSCNYYAFTRKMNRLHDKMGDNSGIIKMSPTLFMIDTTKTDMYIGLMERSSDQVRDIINQLKGIK
jgi:hypothetical protein